MRRTAAEEWNLATNVHDQDVTAAEFVRTFMSAEFNGRALLAKHESEKKKESLVTTKVLPALKEDIGEDTEVWLRHFPDLYGHRGKNDKNAGVHLLSPWEFLMHWECCKLPRPKRGADSEDDGLSAWLEPADPDEPNDKNRKFGPNPEAECCTVLFYPIMGDEGRYFQLRDK